MPNLPRTVWLLLIVLTFWAARDWSRRDIDHPPGILVEQAPRQEDLAGNQVVMMDRYRLIQRARFEVRARVLSTESYFWGNEADLSPIDLALGWGPMSDQSILEQISISQGNRWYFTRYDLPAPLADKSIIQHSSNMHMIPADSAIESDLKALRRGDVINLRGYLVDVRENLPDGSGFRWNTSLRRDDTGNGSCELFLVEFLQREPRP